MLHVLQDIVAHIANSRLSCQGYIVPRLLRLGHRVVSLFVSVA
jgi:hypothetical protein